MYELLNEEAALLSDDALLLASLPMSLPVFFRSFFVSLEHAAVPVAPSTTASATTVLTSFLRMPHRYPVIGHASRTTGAAPHLHPDLGLS